MLLQKDRRKNPGLEKISNINSFLLYPASLPRSSFQGNFPRQKWMSGREHDVFCELGKGEKLGREGVRTGTGK